MTERERRLQVGDAWTVEEVDAYVAATTSEHSYLSTACLHHRHDYCEAMVGYQGEKRPAQCKFCEAKCVCRCHGGAA